MDRMNPENPNIFSGPSDGRKWVPKLSFRGEEESVTDRLQIASSGASERKPAFGRENTFFQKHIFCLNYF